jgi:hypothetical protein
MYAMMMIEASPPSTAHRVLLQFQGLQGSVGGKLRLTPAVNTASQQSTSQSTSQPANQPTRPGQRPHGAQQLSLLLFLLSRLLFNNHIIPRLLILLIITAVWYLHSGAAMG